MRRCLSVKVAILILVASLATPAFASRREDSPGDRFGSIDRTISKIVRVIRNLIPLDLISAQPPKP
jgi:hypothetical protein